MTTMIIRIFMFFAGLAAFAFFAYRGRFLLKIGPIAAGMAAKQLCSLVFISGLQPNRARTLYIDRAIAPLNKGLKAAFDPEQKRVTVTIYGIWTATTEIRDGVGATLTTHLKDDQKLTAVSLPAVQDKPLSIASKHVITKSFDLNALNESLTRAFSEADNTLAVTVLHRGQVVAERYASGINADTPLPGWSMAKSIVATLAGLLVKEGKLDVYQPGIVPEWTKTMNGGESVSLDHLLRMTSGLDLPEEQNGADPTSHMLFYEPDAAAFAAQRELKKRPGEHWEYMSGSTVLASRAIGKAVGGTLESSQNFFREALFMPLGAASFKLETDLAGTFIGSSYAVASAHDWAKLGQLYLNDGVWDGKQLLSVGWRGYVTRHTPQSGSSSYGAGFWTIEHSPHENLPRDIFYANGYQGQYVIIIPSYDLVIVRLGASHAPDGAWTLAEDLMSAKYQ